MTRTKEVQRYKEKIWLLGTNKGTLVQNNDGGIMSGIEVTRKSLQNTYEEIIAKEGENCATGHEKKNEWQIYHQKRRIRSKNVKKKVLGMRKRKVVKSKKR